MTLKLERWSVLGGTLATVLYMSTLVGCGGGAAATLSGTVKVDGEPVPQGTIRLLPEEGTPGEGGTGQITDGNYSISGDMLKSGKHKVVIFGYRETGRMLTEEVEPDEAGGAEEAESGEGGDNVAAGGGTRQIPETEQIVPDKYNRSSQEFIDLTPGENTKDFDLQRT